MPDPSSLQHVSCFIFIRYVHRPLTATGLIITVYHFEELPGRKSESISHKPIWYTLEATCEHTYFNICNYLDICVSYYMSGTLPSTK